MPLCVAPDDTSRTMRNKDDELGPTPVLLTFSISQMVPWFLLRKDDWVGLALGHQTGLPWHSATLFLSYGASLSCPLAFVPSSSLLPVAVTSTTTESNWKRKGFLWLPGCNPSPGEVRAGIQGRNLKSITEAEITEELCRLSCSHGLLGLLSLLPRAIGLGWRFPR